jgi:DNA phosphorothioation-dependent restriction protein DptG
MTQEDHWKKAYRELKEKTDKQSREQHERLTAQFREQYDRIESLSRQINESYERERDLANRLQVSICFVHDDIMTNLSDKAVRNLNAALEDFKKTREHKT